jgi:hypothetical protein|tara:strand:+ start:337 stop:531 length:195 start_codon:yes stop_codon:yes gene_type:complete
MENEKLDLAVSPLKNGLDGAIRRFKKHEVVENIARSALSAIPILSLPACCGAMPSGKGGRSLHR